MIWLAALALYLLPGVLPALYVLRGGFMGSPGWLLALGVLVAWPWMVRS
ncbi:hypothetical protein [Bradyrhizobium sp. Leo121]|nr:hypothetical protein [Bradyrhizobium sp. Leo121]